MMVTVFAGLLGILISLGPVTPQQDDKQMLIGNQERYNRLQAMRVWAIINALDLDPSTEKGLAVLGAIKKFSDARRELFIRGAGVVSELRKLHGPGMKPGEDRVAELVAEYEEIQLQMISLKREEMERMAELLNPLQRARLLLAEEAFKQRLHDAIRGMRSRHGRNF